MQGQLAAPTVKLCVPLRGVVAGGDLDAVPEKPAAAGPVWRRISVVVVSPSHLEKYVAPMGPVRLVSPACHQTADVVVPNNVLGIRSVAAPISALHPDTRGVPVSLRMVQVTRARVAKGGVQTPTAMAIQSLVAKVIVAVSRAQTQVRMTSAVATTVVRRMMTPANVRAAKLEG